MCWVLSQINETDATFEEATTRSSSQYTGFQSIQSIGHSYICLEGVSWIWEVIFEDCGLIVKDILEYFQCGRIVFLKI